MQEFDQRRTSAYRVLKDESKLSAEELLGIMAREPALLNKIFKDYKIQDQALSKSLVFDDEEEFQG